jgi:hypothetical protein
MADKALAVLAVLDFDWANPVNEWMRERTSRPVRKERGRANRCLLRSIDSSIRE